MTGCGVLTSTVPGPRARAAPKKSSVVPSLAVRVSNWLHVPPSAKEDVDLALRGVAIDGRDIGRDDRFAVVQREGVAEVKERSGIARGQFLHLAPGAAEIGEEVGRAGARVAIDGRPEGADERVVAADRD